MNDGHHRLGEHGDARRGSQLKRTPLPAMSSQADANSCDLPSFAQAGLPCRFNETIRE
jgi:hypothetical protein